MSKTEKLKRLFDALDRDEDEEIEMELEKMRNDSEINVNMSHNSIVPLMRARSATAVRILLNAGARVFIVSTSHSESSREVSQESAKQALKRVRLPRLATIQSVTSPMSPLSGSMSPQSLLTHNRTATGSSWDTMSSKTDSNSDLMSTMSSDIGDDPLEQSDDDEMKFFIVCDENGISVLDHAIRSGRDDEVLHLLRTSWVSLYYYHVLFILLSYSIHSILFIYRYSKTT